MDSLVVGERVRFVADSRNGDWSKGTLGNVEKILALPPQNTDSLYVISIGGTWVWATGRDIVSDRQMTIYDCIEIALQDVQPTEPSSSDSL